MSISINKVRNNTDKINSYLLIAFAFLLPISVALTNIIAGMIFLLWFIKADFKNDFNQLKTNKFVIAIAIFLLLHIIGLLWTSNLEWGLYVIKKYLKFLLLPIFMLFVKKEHIHYYLYAFLATMTFSEILSYGVYFDIIPPLGQALQYENVVFMGHIHYNPFLTIAIYILLYYLLFMSYSLNKTQKFFYSIFVLTMSVNMFITGGRAGQVMYFVMLVIILFQYFHQQKYKAIILSMVLIPSIIFLAYNSSNIFKKRVNLAISTVLSYENNLNTSTGHRIGFIINSLEMISKNPVLGTGTGDFKDEFRKIHDQNSPTLKFYVHPHNMYLLQMATLGIFGLLSLVAIFYFAIRYSFNSKEYLTKKLGFTFPVLILIIMLSDSYLFSHYTAWLFIYLSAILYRNEAIETI